MPENPAIQYLPEEHVEDANLASEYMITIHYIVMIGQKAKP